MDQDTANTRWYDEPIILHELRHGIMWLNAPMMRTMQIQVRQARTDLVSMKVEMQAQLQECSDLVINLQEQCQRYVSQLRFAQQLTKQPSDALASGEQNLLPIVSNAPTVVSRQSMSLAVGDISVPSPHAGCWRPTDERNACVFQERRMENLLIRTHQPAPFFSQHTQTWVSPAYKSKQLPPIQQQQHYQHMGEESHPVSPTAMPRRLHNGHQLTQQRR